MVANHKGGWHQSGMTCESKSASVSGASLAPVYQCWRFLTLRMRLRDRAPDALGLRQEKMRRRPGMLILLSW
jgi:hypothetical protein